MNSLYIINKRVLLTNCAILILLATASQCYAQSMPLPVFNNPTVSWEILDNKYNQSEETLSELCLINSSKDAFPASGWGIYFNSAPPSKFYKDSLNFKITHINGDFFKLTPTKSFKGILPGQTAGIKLLTRSLNNITDYAKGFYIVYERDALKPISLELINKSSVDHRFHEKAIANQAYQQNALITNSDISQLSHILPTPISYKYLPGSFTLTSKIKIVSPAIFSIETNYLAREIEKVLGVKPATTINMGQNIILLEENKHIPKEGYELQITPSKIVIAASSNSGIFYGIQSLKSLFPVQVWKTRSSSILLKAVFIRDAPRFSHRAFMMDIARNFLPKEQIIKTIELLSLYKMNVLHLHFSDDEGWRIEIPGLPELTELGAKRGHTLTELDKLIPAYGSGPQVENASGSGYLSRKVFIEILRYANERHIAVIPEYETPGHARAAIKSMDTRYRRLMKEGKTNEAKKYLLRDLNDKSKYESVQGFNDNIINPAVSSVYNFIEKITDETISMYKEAGAPLKTIHFGGDEVPAGVWGQSPIAKALMMKDTSIKNIDELWPYYFSKVYEILKSRNLYLSGWEEIGLTKAEENGTKTMVLDERFVNRNYHTDVWNNLVGNEDLAYKLANAGYKVILTNVTNMYLDLAYNKSSFELGQYWGGYVDVDKPFNFIPLDYYKNQKENKFGQPLPKHYYDSKEKLTEVGKKNIIGLQAPLWSEVVVSKERFEYLLLPKLLGAAERSWAQNPDWAIESDSVKSEIQYRKAWTNFISLIGKKELVKLDYYAGGFNYRIPTPGYIVQENKIKANVLYPNLIIRYTEDGTEPTVNSKTYSTPIPFKENIRMRVFNKEGRGSRTELIVEK